MKRAKYNIICKSKNLHIVLHSNEMIRRENGLCCFKCQEISVISFCYADNIVLYVHEMEGWWAI